MKQKYSSLADMEDDMNLLWLNARTYNEENSQVSGSEGGGSKVGVKIEGPYQSLSDIL